MHIVVHDSINEINSTLWNRLLSDNNPFMRHEFLHGLEQCQCVCESTGWQAAHIGVYADISKTDLIGAMPCYIKGHSYGEYIFDWAWADAHHRHGLEYYPKLSNAIPFTPATGERWLLAQNDDTKEVSNAIIQTALDIVEERSLSSFHSLFLTESQYQQLGDADFSQRLSTQFHWRNQDYKTFDDFLNKMSSKKRKNIKRERRRVLEADIEYRWLSGDALNDSAVEIMYQFYKRTIHYYGAQSYLNKAFFNYIAESFSEQTLFLFAYHGEQAIAGGLYFKSNDTLYGRYWGALNNFHSVHFETCYYQPIEWCINNGFQRFEAGAQGEHKLARGLEPTTTYSAHWIRHPEFRNAIDDFVKREQTGVTQYTEAMQSHTPFRKEL